MTKQVLANLATFATQRSALNSNFTELYDYDTANTAALALKAPLISPSFTTPTLGTVAGGNIAACTALPIVAGTTGTLTVARGGTGLTALGTSLQVLRTNSGATALEFATLSVGSGDALVANPLSQFAATTSAQLRGVLSDETGTGLAYFQGGDIGTPSAGVATNFTGTAASLTSGLATAALGIKTATTTVVVSAATAPTAGQVLTASSTTLADWQTPSSGVPTTITVADESSDTTCFPAFFTASGAGNFAPKTNTAFTLNSATGGLGISTIATSGNLTVGSTLNATYRLYVRGPGDTAAAIVKISANNETVGTSIGYNWIGTVDTDAFYSIVYNGTGAVYIGTAQGTGIRFSVDGGYNDIYAGGRDFGISADSGHTIALCKTSTPATGIAVNTTNGNVTLGNGKFIITTPQTPASASATGTIGTIAWDTSYVYVCTATDTWKRVAIATW